MTGENVILSGGRRLKGGRPGKVNGHKAWVVDIPEVKAGTWRFRQLFVNDSAGRGRDSPGTGNFAL